MAYMSLGFFSARCILIFDVDEISNTLTEYFPLSEISVEDKLKMLTYSQI